LFEIFQFDYSGIIVVNIYLVVYFTIMKLNIAAKQLEALGNQTRLVIYRNLVQAGPAGSSVGDIREKLNIPASTLSHHIAKLVNTGLLRQVRDSRNLVCSVNFENMDNLMSFLVQNCCGEEWIIQAE
jgi:ArsR family transcriptional regulator